MKTIRIKDYYGIYQEIPVSDELYEEWRALQNETQRVHRKEVYTYARADSGTDTFADVPDFVAGTQNNRTSQKTAQD